MESIEVTIYVSDDQLSAASAADALMVALKRPVEVRAIRHRDKTPGQRPLVVVHGGGGNAAGA